MPWLFRSDDTTSRKKIEGQMTANASAGARVVPKSGGHAMETTSHKHYASGNSHQAVMPAVGGRSSFAGAADARVL